MTTLIAFETIVVKYQTNLRPELERLLKDLFNLKSQLTYNLRRSS